MGRVTFNERDYVQIAKGKGGHVNVVVASQARDNERVTVVNTAVLRPEEWEMLIADVPSPAPQAPSEPMDVPASSSEAVEIATPDHSLPLDLPSPPEAEAAEPAAKAPVKRPTKKRPAKKKAAKKKPTKKTTKRASKKAAPK